MVYNATSIPPTINAPAVKPELTPNMFLSISKLFGFTPFLISTKLITYIPSTQNKNTKPILSRKGISYKPLLFAFAKPKGDKKERSTKSGRNLKKTESTNPPIVANNAAFEVAFFQNKPSINIAKIPGDTKPVYSCIY